MNKIKSMPIPLFSSFNLLAKLKICVSAQYVQKLDYFHRSSDIVLHKVKILDWRNWNNWYYL